MTNDTKRCCRCKQTLPLDAFNKWTAQCKGCFRITRREYRLRLGGDCQTCGVRVALDGRGLVPPECKTCRQRAHEQKRNERAQERTARAALRQCVEEAREARQRERSNRMAVVHVGRVPVRVPAPAPARTFVAGQCAATGCTTYFVAQTQTGKARFCSDKCRTRTKRNRKGSRRRALMAVPSAEHIDAAQIYNRDNWRCKLCRRTIDRNRVAPWPWAPSLDHIVPLSAGGAHTYENLQAAHFACNTYKGTRAMDEQLRLVG